MTAADATAGTVLVVVHEGRRSGPPIYALHLLRWLTEHTDLPIAVLARSPGPVLDDLADLVPVTVVEDLAAARAQLETAGVVYVNTAISATVLAETGARPRRVLTHVHELDIGLRHYLPWPIHDLLFAATDHFLVGPEVARANLVVNHGVAPDRITTVPYFVTPHGPLPDRSPAHREALGLPVDAVLVGAAGTRDWRKAPDLFTHLAWELSRRDLGVPVRCAWLGSAIPTEPHWDQERELALLGDTVRVDFAEHQPLPQSWMAELDVFALTSREDCFPLVCLDAGELGIPVVCFDNGGIPELLEACDGGRVVSYPDLAAMADAVEELVRDGEGRRAMGRRLQGRVREHHRLDVAGPRVAEVIGQLLA